MSEAPTIAPGESESQIDPTLFKTDVARADGKLLPLKKRAKNGNALFIEVRHAANPYINSSSEADPGFWVWHQDWMHEPHTGVLLVDTFAKEGDELVSIGHMDWWLWRDMYANGGGNMHGAIPPKTDYERNADQRWADTIAFKLEEKYRGEGIGSLMLATSAVALEGIGMERFFSGGLLDPAEEVYTRFGLHPDDFPVRAEKLGLPLERLTQSPQVGSSINLFTAPST